MIKATLEYPPYPDGTRKKEEGKFKNWSKAFAWADSLLPANGPNNEFIHTMDDILETAYAMVREGNIPKVETTTETSIPGYRFYILKLEMVEG